MTKKRNIERVTNFVQDALAADAEDARAAGAIGYFARVMVQATMPHSKPESPVFERRNGPLLLSMMAPPSVGLPYGTYPRLLLAWLTTQAVRTKSAQLELGDSLSEFMRRLDLDVTGGKKGTVTVLRRQIRRLFSCAVHWSWEGSCGVQLGGLTPVQEAQLWWDPKRPDQVALWRSTVTLNEAFFREIIDRPVPINMSALKVLARERSPMALDIYNWLTYRMSYLRRDQLVPWELLKLQFGADYKRTRKFKENFLSRLKLVRQVYGDAKVSLDCEGLILSPSPSHVPYKSLPGGKTP